jgi:hypothetical protein
MTDVEKREGGIDPEQADLVDPFSRGVGKIAPPRPLSDPHLPPGPTTRTRPGERE